eukprot:SAG31_NODE_36435_length_313_cov_0.962617_1_plen_47_part_10
MGYLHKNRAVSQISGGRTAAAALGVGAADAACTATVSRLAPDFAVRA